MIEIEYAPYMQDVYSYLVDSITSTVVDYFKSQLKNFYKEMRIENGIHNVKLFFRYQDKEVIINTKSFINLMLTRERLKKKLFLDETILTIYLTEDENILYKQFMIRAETLLTLIREFWLDIYNEKLNEFINGNVLEI